jgi:hypothetical protein
MNAEPSADRIPLKRVRGGFRRMVDTELGEEQVCSSCRELWPADNEFFTVSAKCISYECRACTSERKAVRAAA